MPRNINCNAWFVAFTSGRWRRGHLTKPFFGGLGIAVDIHGCATCFRESAPAAPPFGGERRESLGAASSTSRICGEAQATCELERRDGELGKLQAVANRMADELAGTITRSNMGVTVKRFLVGGLIGALLLTACSESSETSNADADQYRAVVIVSGGGAVSPFTTPDEACSSDDGFLAAGNSDTALREFLLAQGKQVFTAPAMVPWGTVVEPDPESFGPFKDCPITLPESMTIMSAGDIDASGEKLARFVNFLHSDYGVTDVDFVGHSNGGLYSRAATRVLRQTQAPITVRSITMLGTPNNGSVPGSYTWAEFSRADCMGETFCETFNEQWVSYAAQVDLGLNREDTFKYLDGPPGWNNAQAGYLDDIPVTLLAGTFFTADGGDPRMWPYDGIVSRYSAWAEGVSDAVIPHRTCWEAPLTHSIFVSDAYNQIVKPTDLLEWDSAITWNSQALERVNQAIDDADSALDRPTRQGC